MQWLKSWFYLKLEQLVDQWENRPSVLWERYLEAYQKHEGKPWANPALATKTHNPKQREAMKAVDARNAKAREKARLEVYGD